MHDVFSANDMVHDQLEYLRNKRIEYDPACDQLAITLEDSQDIKKEWALFDFLDYLGNMHARDDIFTFDDIRQSLRIEQERQSSDNALTDKAYESQLLGAWFGRCIGCCTGKPVEGMSKEQVRDYLQHAGAWPLSGFIPLVDYLPIGVDSLNPSALESTKHHVHFMPRDDDIDYTILGLHLLDKYGNTITTQDIANEWLTLLPFLQTFTAERATYRNLIYGINPESAAEHRNPYREWIGALIRADIYGYVFPSEPLNAMKIAYQDAKLTHRGVGLYGELWAAALISLSFSANSVFDLAKDSLCYTPFNSTLHRTIEHVITMYENGESWSSVLDWIDEKFGDYSWVHVLNNAALIVGSLLFGEEDFGKSIGLTVQAGYDTDSSAATVGSVLGAYLGIDRLPKDQVSELHNSIRSAVHGFDYSAIDALAHKTFEISKQLHNK